MSAVLGGAVITMFTWLAEAAESDLTRLFVALAVGFVLLGPSLNHSVVGFGEILFGIAAGTTDTDWIDLLRNTAVAIVGNVSGGVILVGFVPGIQARQPRAVAERESRPPAPMSRRVLEVLERPESFGQTIGIAN